MREMREQMTEQALWDYVDAAEDFYAAGPQAVWTGEAPLYWNVDPAAYGPPGQAEAAAQRGGNRREAHGLCPPTQPHRRQLTRVVAVILGRRRAWGRDYVGEYLVEFCDGHWRFPGDGVESGETWDSAVQRYLSNHLRTRVKQTAWVEAETRHGDLEVRHARVVGGWDGGIWARTGRRLRWATGQELRDAVVASSLRAVLHTLN